MKIRIISLRYFIFFTAVLISHASFAKKKILPFPKSVQACLAEKISFADLQSLNSQQKIYDLIKKNYLLSSSVILGREVIYKDQNELRKLKYEDGQISLFKILEDQNSQLVPLNNPLNNEARQKNQSLESKLSQLLIRADIRSDWMKIREQRSGGLSVEITTTEGQIKVLQIENEKLKKKLQCSRADEADVCLCAGLK